MIFPKGISLPGSDEKNGVVLQGEIQFPFGIRGAPNRLKGIIFIDQTAVETALFQTGIN